jgi:hypothetical protein
MEPSDNCCIIDSVSNKFVNTHFKIMYFQTKFVNININAICEKARGSEYAF